MTAMRRRVAALIVSVVLVATVAIPSVAVARVVEYQVQFMPVGQSGPSDVIVNAILSPETGLPATVTVPLPAGARVFWSGEILGGDPADDPFRQPSVVPTAGALAAVFRLEQRPVAQVEATVGAPRVRGSKVSAALAWVNTGEEAPYTFSVVVEPGATDVKITPQPVGDPQRNTKGETLYVLAPVRLAAGQRFEVAVEYRRSGVYDSTTGPSPVLMVALTGLVIAVAALIVVVQRERARSA